MKYYFRPTYNYVYRKKLGGQGGMSLLEIIIGVSVFLIIALAVYESYAGLLNLVRISRVKITASNLANEQFEIARNLPYSEVGVIGGVPNGVIPATQNLVRDGIPFVVEAFVRNTDDPFDGTIGGIPNDLSPSDYRLIEIRITCPSCNNFSPLTFIGRVAPRNLEAASTNGSLFVRVFDANGLAVPQANVHIVNNSVVPVVNLNEETNNQGVFQLIDAIPAVDTYEITVSKSGYSSETTYAPGGVVVDVPNKPHSTVVLQNVTQTSFAIDRISTINVSTLRSNCAVVPNVGLSIVGVKTIGTLLDVPVVKYSSNQTTDSLGNRSISNLEWDTYNISLNDGTYDLSGTISPLPVSLSPNSSQNVTLIAANKNPNALLVTVKDAATGLPVTDASVQLSNGGGYNVTKFTNQGFLNQTGWQGGGGQNDFATDNTKYLSSDGNIEDNLPPGELGLKQVFGLYQTHGELISSTFDTGSASNFYQLLWVPNNQPVETGNPNVRFQIATESTNDAGTVWIFKGPDGTASSYYTTGNQNINISHNGDRYLRYKLILDTANNTFSPSISDVSFTFTSSCVPPGQVLFDGLSNGTYTYVVSKTGYQTYTANVEVNSSWQNQDVIFQPE
ncbi:MAG: carboxypeptidase-like regulatory domain-containing protein [Patescibacteria group bacterium]